jgi:hypothetical protein
MKSSRATRSARRRFSGPSKPNRARSPDLGAHARCSRASPSRGFGSWPDSSQHPTRLFPSPEGLPHLQASSVARGVCRVLTSKVVARPSVDSSAVSTSPTAHSKRSPSSRSTMPLPCKSLPVATAASRYVTLPTSCAPSCAAAMPPRFWPYIYYYSAEDFDLLRQGTFGYKINHPIPS